jgi:hypothetical protein
MNAADISRKFKLEIHGESRVIHAIPVYGLPLEPNL